MTQITHFPTSAATLDIDVLKSLAAIADTGSVTAAAARVARSPGAVSMQIKKLEETLGRPLFQRSRQGMTLNADGERMLAYARRLIELHREALDAFRGPALTGEVGIGMIDDLGIGRLSDVMAAFARSNPRVTVNMDIGTSVMLAPKLEAGALDLAILTPGCAVDWLPSDLLLHEEPLIWAGAEGGKAVRARPLPLALSNPGCAWRRAALESMDRSGLPYRIAYTSEFFQPQRAAVLSDLAIAPLPRALIRDGLVELGAADGLAPVGACRIALRIAPDPSPATLALAERVAESYGAAWPVAGAA